MSGADLHLEDAPLERLRSGDAEACDIFASVAVGAHGVRGVVGDATLASRTRDFFEGGDKRRHELIESLEGLRIDYWVALPDGERACLVSCFTPLGDIPHSMVRFFDAIVARARIVTETRVA